MYPFIIIINAVNQHSPSLDLDLLRHVVAAVPEGIVLVLDPEAAQGEECHERSPLMRVWCIWEILCALRAKPNPRPVLVKMGRTVPTTAAADNDSGVGGEKKIGRAGAGAVGVAGAAEGAAEGGAPKRDTQQPPPPPPPFRFQVEWDRDTVALIVKSLSLKDARAKHEPDRLSILADIRHTYPGGAAAMERCVVSALWASYSGRNLAALQFAVQGLGALKQALASGMADLDARNPERWTALHCAASAGLTSAASNLIATGANVNAASDAPTSSSPSSSSSSSSSTSSLPSSPSSVSSSQGAIKAKLRTPLMQAAWANQLMCVEILLEAGADLEMRDVFGKSAADLARSKGHHEVLRILEQHEHTRHRNKLHPRYRSNVDAKPSSLASSWGSWKQYKQQPSQQRKRSRYGPSYL
jgi:ankyrin repeat protein